MIEAVAAPLTGLRAVITRPREQGRGLCSRIEAAGGEALAFPTLLIAGPADPASALAALGRLPQTDLVVFASPNAVRWGLDLMARHGLTLEGKRIIAVGTGTAAALGDAGVRDVQLPAAQQSSEGMLALPALAPERVAGCSVLIIRGNGGRELLRRELTRRGARVTVAEVYRRECPAADPAPLARLLAAGGVQVIVATSAEGLRNLFAIMDSALHPRLRQLPMLVVGARMAAAARALGVERLLVADDAGDPALTDALIAWWSPRRPTA